jgi:hypothetical protein
MGRHPLNDDIFAGPNSEEMSRVPGTTQLQRHTSVTIARMANANQSDKPQISHEEEEIEIAHDFRRQLQERYPIFAGDRTAGDVIGWSGGNREMLGEINRKSWSKFADDSFIETFQNELEQINLKNPRDEPFTYAIVKGLCEEIESACREFGITLRSGVSFGVAPTFELTAERYPVHFTETSVITLSAGLISFCSHLSKVMSLSLICEPANGALSFCNEPKQVFTKIGSDPDLKKFWTEVIGAYAFGLGPLNVEQRIVPYPYSIIRVQLLTAMERFAIAHEYAHHIARHGSLEEAQVGGDPASLRNEFDADIFALGLSRYMERNEPQPNFYAMSGAGAVLLLKGLECVRRTREIFASGSEAQQQCATHPETAERIAYLETLDSSLATGEQTVFRQIRGDFVEIIDSVWMKLRPWYIWMHEDGLRPEAEYLGN